MESPADEESTRLLDKALGKLMGAEDGKSDEPIQAGDTTEFHRYMDLPPELRDQIRNEIIVHQLYPNRRDFSKFATVSREWQDDVEKLRFGTIRIDLMNEEDASKFKEVFVPRRRGFLKFLEIIIDDRKTGPWHSAMGLLQISQFMEKVGHLLQFISSWDVDLDKYARQRPNLHIDFVSLDLELLKKEPGFVEGAPNFRTSSFWMESHVDLLTNSGLLPISMPLWAVNSSFPTSLGIATYLTFPLDCIPLPASLAMIRTMPNLDSCMFGLSFEKDCLEGFGNLTDIINQLPVLTPRLSSLLVHNPDLCYVPNSATATLRNLSDALRDYSQGLESLCVHNIDLHQSFFQPFSDKCEIKRSLSTWQWPNLKDIFLDFGTYGPYVAPGRFSLTPVELLLAAGRAATAMPRLEAFNVCCTDEDDKQQFFVVQRECYESSARPGRSLVEFLAFSKDDIRRILAAWVPFMRAEACLVREEFDDDSAAYGGNDDIEDDGVDSDYDVPDEDQSEDGDFDEDYIDLYTRRYYEAVPGATA